MTLKLPWKTLAALLCAVISPKLAEEGLLEPGLLKFGWLNTLNASSSNARMSFSRIGKMCDSCWAIWNPIGPSSALCHRLPYVPEITGLVNGFEAEVRLQKALRLR